MASKCRKFVPNIFNKTKCQNCFGAKEFHSAEALENNKASRKVSKCGYLFVSPDFDFSNPLDRSRRWQRRFFVLYDDGELTFSVDENPDTIPQGTVDMNKCTDVQDAEKSTTHSFSLAIITPEKTYYVKGQSKEEVQWWHDVLVEYPRSLKAIKPRRKPPYNGSNKENFQPEGSELKLDGSIDKWIRERFEVEKVKGKSDVPSFSTYKGVRSLKHKYDKNYQEGLRKSSSLHDLSSEDKDMSSSLASSRFLSRSGDRLDYVSKADGLYCLSGRQRILSDTKYTNPYSTLPRIHVSSSLLSPKPYPGAQSMSLASSTLRRGSFDDHVGRNKNLSASERSRLHRERSTSLKDFPAQLSLPRDSGLNPDETIDRVVPSVPDDGTQSESMSADETESNETDELKMARSSELNAACRAQTVSSAVVSETKGTKYEDLVYMKKGWLIKQGSSDRDARKHWFVLAGNSLRYFRDAKAEDSNSLDGRIDLSSCYEVSELNTPRNYGFKIKTRNGEYILAAMTSGIRNNWMKAIRLCMDLHSSGLKHGLSSTLTGKALAGFTARAVDDFELGATSSPTAEVTGTTGETAFQLVGRRETNKKDLGKNIRRHHSDVNPGNVSKMLTVKEFSANLDTVMTSSASSQSADSDRGSQHSTSDSSGRADVKSSPRSSRASKIPRHHSPSLDMTWSSNGNIPMRRYVEGSDNVSTSSQGNDSSRVPKRSIVSESSKEEEKREMMRRAKSPSARVKEKSRAAKAPRLHSPPPVDDGYSLNLSTSSKDTYSGETESLGSDLDEVDIGDQSLSQVQYHDAPMQHDDDDDADDDDENMMGGASSGSVGDGMMVEFLETEVESLKDRLEHSQQQLVKMQETNRDLKVRLQTAKDPLQSHHMDSPYCGGRWGQQPQQYDAGQVQSMKRQLKDSKDTVHKHKAEIDNLKAKLDMSVSKLTGTEKALSEALKELKQEKDRFLKLTTEWNRRVRTLETQLKDTSHKLDRSRENITLKERDCRRLETEVKSHQQKAREQEREILKLKAVELDYKQMKEKLDSKDRELLAISAQIREKDIECSKLSEKYEKKVQEMENDYHNERDDLENHLEQMKAQLCAAHERQTTMTDSLTNNMADILREKDDIICQLEEKLIESDKKMVDMNEELQAEMSENAELLQSVDVLQEDKQKLQDKLREMETRLVSLQDRISQFESENISLRKHLEELRMENSLLGEKLDSEKLASSQNQKEKDELQKTIQDLNKQIQGLQLRLIERFEDIDQTHSTGSTSSADTVDLLHSILVVDSELKEVNMMLLKLRQLFDTYIAALQGENKVRFISLADMIEDIGRKCLTVQEVLKDSFDPSLTESGGFDYRHEVTVDGSSDSQEIIEEYRGLKSKFDRAVAELRKLRKEVNDVYSSYDELEVNDKKLKEKVKSMEEDYKAQLEQMVKRVEGLTTKLDRVHGVKGGEKQTKKANPQPPNTNPLRPHTDSDTGVLSQEIEWQLNDLEGKLSLVEKVLTENVPDNPGHHDQSVEKGAPSSPSKSRMSLSPGDSQNIVTRLKEMKAQLEETNIKLNDIAVDINAQSEKMDTSDNPGDHSLQSRIQKYGKKIDNLTQKLEAGAGNFSGNPHHGEMHPHNPGVHVPSETVAVNECLKEVKERLQEINEQLDNLEDDSDSDDEEQEQTTMEDVREKVADLMDYLEQRTSLTSFDWKVLGTLSSQLATCSLPGESEEHISHQEKLQLYADRLALESVIISEMAFMLQDKYKKNNKDPVMKEIDSLNCQLLLLQQKLELETRSMQLQSADGDVLSSYAALLAEKIAVEGQLTDSTLDQDQPDDDSNDCSQGLIQPKVLAVEALLRSQLDAHINQGLQKSLNDLESVSTHIVTKTLVQGELTYALHKVKEKLAALGSDAESYQKYREFVYKQLQDREKLVLGLVDKYQVVMVKSLAVIIAKESQEVTVFEGAESVLEDVCSEISTIMEKHIQSFKEKVRSAEDTETAQKYNLIVNVLRADREVVLSAIKKEHASYTSQEEPRQDEVELPLQSLDATIDNFGQIMSQKSIIRATAENLHELSATYEPWSDSDSADDEDIQTEPVCDIDKSMNIFVQNLSESLLKDAASKQALVGQLRGENSSGEMTGDSQRLDSLVLKMPNLQQYPPHFSKYAETVVKESVFQAQLTYMMYKNKLQHEQDMEHLKQNYHMRRKPEQMSESSRDSEPDIQTILLPLEEVLDTKYVDEYEVLKVLEKQFSQLKTAVGEPSRNWTQVEDQVRQLQETFLHEMTVAQDRHEVHLEVFKQEMGRIEKLWEDREQEQEGYEGQCADLQEYLESMKAIHEEEVERMKQDVMMAVSAIRANEEQSETQLTDQVQKLTRQLFTQAESYKTFLIKLKQDLLKSGKSELAKKVDQQLAQIQASGMLSQDAEMPPVTPKVSASDSVVGNQSLVEEHRTQTDEEKSDRVLDMSQHEHELELMKREKEEALAEEMRNTKAALDAMRKAYEEELAEEKEKFREALTTMYTDDYVSEIKRRHEIEIEKLSEELKQTSMHYSSKCEDYKLLELKLQQNKMESESHIGQLMQSNASLDSMVKREIDGLKEFIKKKPTSSNLTTGNSTVEEELFDAQIMIRVKDAELQKLRAQVKIFENNLARSTEEQRQAMTQYLQLVKQNQELKTLYNKDTQHLKEKLEDPGSRRPIRRTPSFHQRARSPSPQTSTSKKDNEHTSRDVHRRRRIGPQDLRRSKSSPSLPYVFDSKGLTGKVFDKDSSRRGKDLGKSASSKDISGKSPRTPKSGKH